MKYEFSLNSSQSRFRCSRKQFCRFIALVKFSVELKNHFFFQFLLETMAEFLLLNPTIISSHNTIDEPPKLRQNFYRNVRKVIFFKSNWNKSKITVKYSSLKRSKQWLLIFITGLWIGRFWAENLLVAGSKLRTFFSTQLWLQWKFFNLLKFFGGICLPFKILPNASKSSSNILAVRIVKKKKIRELKKRKRTFNVMMKFKIAFVKIGWNQFSIITFIKN